MSPLSTSSHQSPSTSVLLIGIGGPTCSGKTTLAKHILSLLPNGGVITSFIIHQDDFAPPESSLKWNQEVGSADWDDPATSVDWPRLRSTLAFVKERGTLPPDHGSHDEANPLPDRPVAQEIADSYRKAFRQVLSQQQRPTHIVFLDGFLLYYDRHVRATIDVPIFLRIGKGLLQERRSRRGGYVTADGDKWEDPPLYFSHILWPSHLKAHSHLFKNGDVETGEVLPRSCVPASASQQTHLASTGRVKDEESGSGSGNGSVGEEQGEKQGEVKALALIEAQRPPGRGEARRMDDLVREGCEIVLEALRGWKRSTAVK